MLSKINTFLRLLVVGLLIYPMPVLADHVPTQPAYGQNLTTDNNAGTITIGILSSDGFEDSPPENYTIFFSVVRNFSCIFLAVQIKFNLIILTSRYKNMQSKINLII